MGYRILYIVLLLIVVMFPLSPVALPLSPVMLPSAYAAQGISTEDLARSSELVVYGVVYKVKSVWDKKLSTIVSTAEVKVVDVIKGNLSQKLVKIEYEGGTVGKVNLCLTDGVAFSRGEEVIVFLRPNGEKPAGSPYIVYSGGQGKYTVVKNIAKKDISHLEGNVGEVDGSIPVTELVRKIKSVQ